jgi:hypothetical protein
MRRPMTTHTAVAQPLCLLAADEDPGSRDDLAAAIELAVRRYAESRGL